MFRTDATDREDLVQRLLRDIHELLIGPASQIVSEPVELIGPELQDPGLVDRLRARTAELAPRKPEAEPANTERGAAGTDDRPGFDDLV